MSDIVPGERIAMAPFIVAQASHLKENNVVHV
jgi:hypothetical protein